MAGHLFLVRGDLRHLACDAVLVPSGTNRRGDLGEVADGYPDAWAGRLQTDADGCVTGERPDGSKRAVLHAARGAGPQEPALWIGHTGERLDDPPEWFAEAVVSFIRDATHGFSRSADEHGPLDDPRPLLALPLVGVGGGGKGPVRGQIMKAVVGAIIATLEGTAADVALVLMNSEAYSAAQQARESAGVKWPEIGDAEQTAQELADFARRDRLVVFFGAGASMGAGLPSWHGLLEQLAQAAGLSARLPELKPLDARDAATLIERALNERGSSIDEAIATATNGTQSSLVHALLASLPLTEAATTNYDNLFERAWTDVVGPDGFRVLPGADARDAKRWLLKLHGSVGGGRLVLSRNDYLRFEGEDSALAGLVQAMLLTRHMLFVGYSLSDDNFHRIAHQARAALGTSDARSTRAPFGTALTPEPGIANELWKNDVRFVHGGGPRRVAIVLDRIGALASAPSAYVLDPEWDALLNPAERELREAFDSISAIVRTRGAELSPSIRGLVSDFQTNLGADGVSATRPKGVNSPT